MATQVSNSPLNWDTLLTAVHAWQLRPHKLGGSELRKRWLFCLSAAERSLYSRFQTEELRSNYFATRFLCRMTLSRYANAAPTAWRFSRNPQGKPMIVAPPSFVSLSFNVAHTEEMIICAVTRAGQVGVDVEDTRRPVDVSLIARHFFSRGEQTRLAGLPRPERTARFFEQWVRKEAYVKATGLGLAESPERLTVAQDHARPSPFGHCQLSLHRPDSNHMAAVAVVSRGLARTIGFEWLVASDVEAALS